MTSTRRGSAAAAAAAPELAAQVPGAASGRGRRAAISTKADATSSKARASSKSSASTAQAADANTSAMDVDAPVVATATAAAKKGGKRERAAPTQEQSEQPQLKAQDQVAQQEQQQPAKRPRGRPRKSAPTEPTPEPATQPPGPSPKPEPQQTVEGEPAPKRSKRGPGRPSKASIAAAAQERALEAAAASASPRTAVPGEQATAAAAAPAAAEAAHQLQPYDSSDALTAAPAPVPVPAPTGSPTRQVRPLLAQQLLRSPPASPRRPLVATAAAATMFAPNALRPVSPKAAAPAPAAAAVPSTAPAPASTAAAPPAVVAAAAAAPAPLTDQEVVQVRRLLQTGALAGTLLSCAAAGAATAAAGSADGVAGAAAPTAGSSGSGSAEPAGRAAQFKELVGMVNECCSSGRGGAVYISGLPGTGKTYTVSRLLAALPSLAAAASAASSGGGSGGDGGGGVTFCCATLNCMTLDDPAALYGRLQDELTRAAAESSGSAPTSAPTATAGDASAAHDSLASVLARLSVVRPAGGAGGGGTSKAKAAAAKAGAKAGAKRGCGSDTAAVVAPVGSAGHSQQPARRVFVVVLDEVDRLLRRREGGEDLARLFQLPSAPGVSLVLLAVANSLDLTERMMPLLRARGLAPRHMVFTAYSRPQVLAILSAQLGCHPRGRRLFDDGALDMVAKSVSSSSGDLRQALKACRTALDVLQEHNRANPAAPRASVGIREVHAALQRISSAGNGAPAVVAKVRGLPPQQQLVLLALAGAVGARAAADGAAVMQSGGGGGKAGPAGAAGFLPGGVVFTGVRAKFVDAVAFREIGNQPGGGAAAGASGAVNPGACFGEGPTPTKPGGAAVGGRAAAGTPATGRVRGVTGPGGAAGTPGGSCAGGGRTPPSSRTPASRAILAGDAGLALGLADVYVAYGALCRQLEIPAMSESAFRTDALPGLECDGLLRVQEGRTPAATRLSLRAMVRDVQAALADNVMFKRLLGAKAPPPGAPAAGVPAAGLSGGVGVRA